jgi:tripartite-type tricarboxylate transporter receptor subunit TctC
VKTTIEGDMMSKLTTAQHTSASVSVTIPAGRPIAARRRRASMVLAAGLCATGMMLAVSMPSLVHAQAFPTRTLKLIVPDAPGGSPDMLGRVIADKMGASLGQTVVVENKPGAAGLVAAEAAARSAADGYTMFMSTTSVWAILPNVRKNLPYDPDGFLPLTRVANASNVMVVNPSLPVRSVAELVALVKEKPGTVNYASAGVATPAHLAGEMFNLLGGVRMTHVPYRGAGPALLDVIAGQVQLIITSPIAAGGHIRNGKVTALATTGPQRNPGLPDLPTIADTLPGYEITQSWGLTVPVGTPPDIVKRLYDEVVKALQHPDVRQRISGTGAVPVIETPEAFGAFIKAERARLGDVITRTGVVLAN